MLLADDFVEVVRPHSGGERGTGRHDAVGGLREQVTGTRFS
jgi:hypothetical protein